MSRDRTPPNPSSEYAVLRAVEDIAEIGRERFNSLANPGWRIEPGSGGLEDTPGTERPSYNPFLTYEFFGALHASGSARAETGWLPQFLCLEEEGTVTGFVPGYLKGHSQGEYVFDHGWADAFERAGGRYYPKYQISVPFTPATGRRLLVGTDPGKEQRAHILADGIGQFTRKISASSAHITFLPEDEWALFGDRGYLLRTDQQFHWENDSYGSFSDFLDALASRKRKAIRKERRAALENGIEVEWLRGSDITEDHWDHFFGFYMDTGSRKWGRPYLNRKFFSMIGESVPNDILLIMARREGRYIAGALNMIGSDTLFGRYWGCREDHPFLHFEICYYQAIDWAIQNGRKRVEAGAQGGHKLARGYLPALTRSAHYIPHEGFRLAIENYLEQERAAVERENRALQDYAPFKKG